MPFTYLIASSRVFTVLQDPLKILVHCLAPLWLRTGILGTCVMKHMTLLESARRPIGSRRTSLLEILRIVVLGLLLLLTV